MNIDNVSRQGLVLSGWSDDWCFGTNAFEEACRANGYASLSEAVRFVSEFGGVRGEHRAYRSSSTACFDLDPLKALRDISKERVDNYVLRFGEVMVPVGEVLSGHLTLMISSGGSVLGGYDDYLCIIGDSIENGINAIFNFREYIEVS